MAILIGGTDVVVFKDPLSSKSDTFRWWPERGLMHWENQRNGQYGSQSVKLTLLRLQGISEMIGNSRTGKGFHRPDEVRAYQDFVDRMIVLCQNARHQGMPDDPRASKQKADEWKAKRKSRAVVLPGLHSKF